MKIDNSSIKPLVPGIVPETEPRAGKPDQSEEVPASTNVQLSSLAAHLNQAEQALADTPVVDAARVAELTQAIRDGSFTVDATKVADKLIQTAADLIRAHKN